MLRYEADISISLTKPAALDLTQVKLGRMHVILFASQRYLETYGKPRTYEELLKHRLVVQFAEQTAASAILAQWFPVIPPENLLVMKTNASSANYWAVSSDVGNGIFPTYVYAAARNLCRLISN